MRRSVAAAILNPKENSILVIKRRDVPIWVLPGGGIDPEETPEEAVIRETFEETGLKVAIKRLVAIYTPINRLGSLTYFFECDRINGNLETGNETAAIGFYPIDTLPNPFFHIHQAMLKDLLEHRSDVIKKPLSQSTYLEFFKYLLKHPIRVIRFAFSQLGFPINS